MMQKLKHIFLAWERVMSTKQKMRWLIILFAVLMIFLGLLLIKIYRQVPILLPSSF